MILVTGAGGQLGSALRRLALPGELRALPRGALDVTDATAVRAALRESDARLVINAAAWTDVDGAERAPEAAFAANRDGPAVLARACADAGLPLFHVSTDHVFDGQGERPWREDDAVAPLGVYGCSKAAGEAAIRAVLGPHLILRTSWLFGPDGSNFVTIVLRRAQAGDALAVVDDHVGGPTPAHALAQALLDLAARHLEGEALSWGTWHFAGQPFVSRHAFAQSILDAARAQGLLSGPVPLRAIGSADWPGSRLRPANARLDGTAAARDLGLAPPDWRAGLATFMAELAAAGQRPGAT